MLALQITVCYPVKDGAEYEVVLKGRTGILNEGIGLVYTPADVAGKLTIEKADEEVSAGKLARNGFFDRITPGDEVFLVPEKQDGKTGNTSPPQADPELRSLLRALR